MSCSVRFDTVLRYMTDITVGAAIFWMVHDTFSIRNADQIAGRPGNILRQIVNAPKVVIYALWWLRGFFKTQSTESFQATASPSGGMFSQAHPNRPSKPRAFTSYSIQAQVTP